MRLSAHPFVCVLAGSLLSVAAARADSWSTITSPTPAPPASHTTAIYDSLGERFILFGGGTVWSVTRAGEWSQWSTGAPAATGRTEHASTFDPLRRRVIVFGGLSTGTELSDVWMLSLAGSPQWTQLVTTGTPPPPRRDASLVYDPFLDRLIVFGGYTSDGVNFARFNDVWELPLTGEARWNQLATTATPPDPRNGAGAIFDETRKELVVFGGDQAPGSYNEPSSELWTLTLGSGAHVWSLSSATGTGVRLGHQVVYDKARDRMLVFGGITQSISGPFSYDFSNDTWAYSLETKTWSLVVPTGKLPERRWHHAAALATDPDELWVMCGEVDVDAVIDLQRLSLAPTPAWTEIDDVGLTPGVGAHLAVWDASHDRMIIVTGISKVWALSSAPSPSWTRLATLGTAPAVIASAAIYDPVRQRMVMFGGVLLDGSGTQTNAVWSLSLSGTPTWSQLSPTGTPPSGRYQHLVVYDAPRDRMLVYGGFTASGSDDQVWSLSLGSLSWSQVVATGTPGVHVDVSGIYAPLRDTFILIGNGNQQPYELTLDATPTWTALAPSGVAPSNRSNATAIYDPGRDRLVHFGGITGSGIHSDAHALSLGATLAWTTLDSAPRARAYHVAVHDPINDRMLVYGGRENSISEATPVVDALQFDSTITATLLTRFEAEARNGAVELRWQFGNPDQVLGTTVERAERETGPWSTLPITAQRIGRLNVALDDGADAGRSYYYRLIVELVGGSRATFGPITTTLKAAAAGITKITPNPASTTVRIDFAITREEVVRMRVFDPAGRQVEALVEGRMTPGRYTVAWDTRRHGRQLPAGMYFIRWDSPGLEMQQRIVLVK